MTHWLTHGEWVMSVLTAIYVMISAFALFAIKRQAEIAEKSTNALIASERAWIMASIVWAADLPGLPRPTTLRFVSHGSERFSIDICLICRNEGKTPAWITERRAWLVLYHEVPPHQPDTNQPIAFSYSDLVPLSVGGEALLQNAPQCDGNYPELVGPSAVFYGVVRYRDVFGNHETWFGYTIQGDPGRKNPRIERLVGFPEYNKNT